MDDDAAGALQPGPQPDRVGRVNGSGIRRDGVAGVCQDVDERQPEPLGVGHKRGERRVELQADDGGSGVGPGRRLGRILAERVEIGWCQVEFDWLGKVQDLGHQAVEARGFFIDVGDRDAQFLCPGRGVSIWVTC